MTELARLRRSFSQWRAPMRKHYGHAGTERLLFLTRDAVKRNTITVKDAHALLRTLASGDLSGLEGHPAYNSQPPTVTVTWPDGAVHQMRDPRHPLHSTRTRAIDALGMLALDAAQNAEKHAGLRTFVVRVAAVASRSASNFARQLRDAKSLETPTKNSHREQRKTPESLGVECLIDAPRPGPFTGVVPVSV